ncbi:TPA: hypothetical protein ACJXXT_000202 [Pseudomonas aeruginosa]
MIELKIKLNTIAQELTFALTDKELDRIEKRITDLQATLKKHERSIGKLAADVGTYRYGLKPNEAKASGLEAELLQARNKKDEVIADIASLTAFKDDFKKRLSNKDDETFKAKLKSEILANPELLIDLILEEKKRDKAITLNKYIAKVKRLMKDASNEKTD